MALVPNLAVLDGGAGQWALPALSDAFKLQLREGEWAALLPRHHMMWVSPDPQRALAFVNAVNQGTREHEVMLSEEMTESFETYYIDPRERHAHVNPVPQGEVLDSTICFLATNDCNLGCKYCFSGAQPKKFGAISKEIAWAAIDLGVRNALLHRMRTGHGQLAVRFFGGGEPTEYWDRFQGIVDYARERAAQHQLSVVIATITNGQIDEQHFEWFRRSVDEINVSMDGPPEIHNAQRPTAAGEHSFDKSWKFITAMDAFRVNIKTIRVTVTKETVRRMPEIAEFFWSSLSRAYPLQFEPVYFSEVGRQNCDMPEAIEFVEAFREVEALERARHAAGRRHNAVGTATKPLTIRANAYCDSLEGRGLFVTPDGYLSLCTEISTVTDPRKDDYFIGGYDRTMKRFRVTEEGAKKIRCGPPWYCRGCHAQYSCRGGCEPRSQNPDKYIKKWWCRMVRENLRSTWSDVRNGVLQPRARIGDRAGEELIWLPIWTESASMDG